MTAILKVLFNASSNANSTNKRTKKQGHEFTFTGMLFGHKKSTESNSEKVTQCTEIDKKGSNLYYFNAEKTQKGEANGHGIYSLTNGDYFCGDFVNKQLHGYVTCSVTLEINGTKKIFTIDGKFTENKIDEEKVRIFNDENIEVKGEQKSTVFANFERYKLNHFPETKNEANVELTKEQENQFFNYVIENEQEILLDIKDLISNPKTFIKTYFTTILDKNIQKKYNNSEDEFLEKNKSNFTSIKNIEELKEFNKKYEILSKRDSNKEEMRGLKLINEFEKFIGKNPNKNFYDMLVETYEINENNLAENDFFNCKINLNFTTLFSGIINENNDEKFLSSDSMKKIKQEIAKKLFHHLSNNFNVLKYDNGSKLILRSMQGKEKHTKGVFINGNLKFVGDFTQNEDNLIFGEGEFYKNGVTIEDKKSCISINPDGTINFILDNGLIYTGSYLLAGDEPTNGILEYKNKHYFTGIFQKKENNIFGHGTLSNESGEIIFEGKITNGIPWNGKYILKDQEITINNDNDITWEFCKKINEVIGQKYQIINYANTVYVLSIEPFLKKISLFDFILNGFNFESPLHSPKLELPSLHNTQKTMLDTNPLKPQTKKNNSHKISLLNLRNLA